MIERNISKNIDRLNKGISCMKLVKNLLYINNIVDRMITIKEEKLNEKSKLEYAINLLQAEFQEIKDIYTYATENPKEVNSYSKMFYMDQFPIRLDEFSKCIGNLKELK